MTRKIKAIVLIPIILLVVGYKDISAPRPYPFPALAAFPRMPVAAANPVTIEGAELGRYLFYDTILSRGRNMSCASCHKQAYAFSDAPNQFSTGNNRVKQTRNTPALFNLAWYPALFWDGRAASIEEQALHPVSDHNEMNLLWPDAVRRVAASPLYIQMFTQAFGNVPIDSTLIARAIGQFERTLLSYRSKYDQLESGKAVLTKEEADGFVLVNDMTKGDCLHCHTTDADALGTTMKYSNNGLDEIADVAKYKDKGRGGITKNTAENGWFKIPSLRNVAITAPYMHDGRFKTLEAVLEFYSSGVKHAINVDSKMGFAHQGGNKLTKEEQKKIIAFLRTMTDAAFITDPAFSNPFAKRKSRTFAK